MVRWKAVREALREPRAAGLMVVGGAPFGFVEEVGGWLVRLDRSLRIEVLCLRAPLKVVFCGWFLLAWLLEMWGLWGEEAYHVDAVDAILSLRGRVWKDDSYDGQFDGWKSGYVGLVAV